MFRFWFYIGVILILFLSASVTLAQGVEPTATPRPSTTNTILTEVSDAVDRLGIFNFISAGLLVFVLVIAWQGLKPLIQSGTDANRRADDATQQMIEMTDKLMLWHEKQAERDASLDETRHLNAVSLAQTVKAQEGLANFMSQMETKSEAQQSRQSSVQEINEHTSDVVHTLNQALEQVSRELVKVQTDLQKTMTQKAFNDGIQPIVSQLQTISRQVTRIHDRLSHLSIPTLSTDKEQPDESHTT